MYGDYNPYIFNAFKSTNSESIKGLHEAIEYMAKQLRKVDTFEEATNVAQLVLQGITVFITKAMPAVLGLRAAAEEIVNFVSNAAGVLLAIKVAGMIMEWIKWQRVLGHYKEISGNQRYQVRLKYAENLVQALDDIGDKPMPESLQKDIRDFFIQEAKDAEDFVQFAQYVETVREHIEKRDVREQKKQKRQGKKPGMPGDLRLSSNRA